MDSQISQKIQNGGIKIVRVNSFQINQMNQLTLILYSVEGLL